MSQCLTTYSSRHRLSVRRECDHSVVVLPHGKSVRCTTRTVHRTGLSLGTLFPVCILLLLNITTHCIALILPQSFLIPYILQAIVPFVDDYLTVTLSKCRLCRLARMRPVLVVLPHGKSDECKRGPHVDGSRSHPTPT